MRLPNNELFAMEPSALEAFVARVNAIGSPAARRLEAGSATAGQLYDVASDGTATISVSGVLLKSASDAREYRAYGIEATGYSEILSALATAEADPQVQRVELAIDSPGGQVAGIHAVSDRLAGYSKPVSAHAGTMVASAAYWIASQAKEITAPRGSQIGSIGAYVVVADMSRMAENAGIKVHVVASGKHKGAGVPGASVTEEQLAEIQQRIDAVAVEFVNDISRGRGKSTTQIQESADGRVYSSLEAVQRGLIDRITSDPSKDRQMVEALKDFAALLAEYPAQAKLIGEKVAAGAAVAEIRSAIEKAQADSEVADKIAKAEKAAAEANTAAETLKAQTAAALVEVAALKASLAESKAAHDALKALAAGTVEANKIKPDPAEQSKPKKSSAEVAKMSPAEAAAFFQAGGEQTVEK